jgi:polar amino acid transport system permease protein
MPDIPPRPQRPRGDASLRSQAVTDQIPPPPHKPARRIKPVDAVIIVIAVAAIAFVVYRVDYVLTYTWAWGRVFEYVVVWDDAAGWFVPNLLLKGLFMTLRLAFWGMLIASVVGLLMGLFRTSQNLFLRTMSRIYVELIRNIPPVVFIFVFYFFISSQLMPLIGIDNIAYTASPSTVSTIEVLFSPIGLFSNFLAGVICLAMFEGAYITEIVRAGVQSIEKEQWEAARAIGLSRFNVFRDVILPQATRRILPPLAGQFITLIKDSAIVSLISIQELTFLANEVAATTTKVFETWIIVGFLYFVVCYAFALLFGHLERRMLAGQR